MARYIISLLIIILLMTTGIYKIHTETKNKNVDKYLNMEYNINSGNDNIVIRNRKKEPEYIVMVATAYDLSIQCCGKSYKNPSRGITRSKYNLTNKTHKQALTVASNKFPIGTKLKLEFPESHKQYDGIYIVRDTGDFKENVLDVYIGDFGEKVHKETVDFGKVNIKVSVVN